ncbi:hypothetical protein GCM10023069_25530 [Shinella granuli]
MKRPSKSDGKGQSLAGDVLPFPSLARSAGPTTIQFSSPAAKLAGDTEGAGVSSASASSTFVSLGSVTHAVVLRLRGGSPKVNVLAGAQREEWPTRRPFNQPEEEEPR